MFEYCKFVTCMNMLWMLNMFNRCSTCMYGCTLYTGSLFDFTYTLGPMNCDTGDYDLLPIMT